jgi:hypothetical protein
MFRPGKTKLTVLAILLCANGAFAAPDARAQSATKADQSAHQPAEADVLPNGLYLVLRSGDAAMKVQPAGEAERMLADDYHFLEPAEREPVKYLVLQTTPFVPFILGAGPVEDREEGGKPRLQLQLTEDQKKPLEDFTRANLGGTVAIVIGGEIVTTHKIKSVITGGRLQVTRCTEHGCETLFTKLLVKHQ